jgi:hypothetical protein
MTLLRNLLYKRINIMAWHRTLARLLVVLSILAVTAHGLSAADKTVKGSLIKVDVKKKILYVKTDDGKKEFIANAATKFIGPKGGVSDEGIKDDRLKPGAALTLLVAGNNKTLREVHLPTRTGEGS